MKRSARFALATALLATACVSMHAQTSAQVVSADARLAALTQGGGKSTVHGSQGNRLKEPNHDTVVYGLRKFPYPYKAMLAICSDADHETLRKFNLIHEFLNTTQMTPMGHGLGLDISDSFFMYNATNLPTKTDMDQAPMSHELSYFRGTSNERYAGDVIDAYIHAGWMDNIHTYGDFSQVDKSTSLFTRALAKQSIAALKAASDVVTVWTDHGNASNVDNFGAYGSRRFYNYQQGANPNSPYYHTDLTIPYGIHFVWTDDNSDMFGRDSMIYPLSLPDGQRVWGFSRYTNRSYNVYGRPNWVWSSDNLSQALTYDNLKTIIYQREYAIIAQHLESDNTNLPLAPNTIDALRLLANQYHAGNILVARTSRLLQYNVTQQFVRYHVTRLANKVVIHITSIADPVLGTHVPRLEELRGLTFYSSNPFNTEIDIGNTPIDPSLIQYNPADNVAPSISIQWFQPDTTNYAIQPPGVW